MRILLSAYMCEPHRGSESEVGWRWATGLAQQGHDVVLLTRSTHQQSALQEALAAHSARERITLVAFDIKWQPAPAYNTPRGIRFHYLLWQLKALKVARALHTAAPFDLAHHVTLASVRQPSFLGHLNVPFVFGPVGGGEQAPWRLLDGTGMDGKLNGIIRSTWNALIRFDPILRQNFRLADVIYCTSEETRGVLPKWAQKKSLVHLAVALDAEEFPQPCLKLADAQLTSTGSGLRIINAGRFLHWKAMHLGFRAFAKVLKTYPDARLSMVGEGPKEADWRAMTVELGISDSVDWYGWIGRQELLDAFSSHHMCLYPSLHDSGGFVVLEAMAHSLPVVCMNLGGPGQMVDNTSGRVIDGHNVNATDVVERISDALLELANDENLRLRLGRGARRRASEFTWERLQSDVYNEALSASHLNMPSQTAPNVHSKDHNFFNDTSHDNESGQHTRHNAGHDIESKQGGRNSSRNNYSNSQANRADARSGSQVDAKSTAQSRANQHAQSEKRSPEPASSSTPKSSGSHSTDATDPEPISHTFS